MIGPHGIHDNQHNVGPLQFRRPQVLGKGDGRLQRLTSGQVLSVLAADRQTDHGRFQQGRSRDGRSNFEKISTAQSLGLLTHGSSPLSYDTSKYAARGIHRVTFMAATARITLQMCPRLSHRNNWRHRW